MVEVKTKVCTGCGVRKSIQKFYVRTGGGLRSHCKSCQSLEGKRYAQTPARQKSLKKYAKSEQGQAVTRRRNLKFRYNTTPEEYDQFLTLQQKRCAICKSPDPKGRGTRFHIDHDHVTGKVRGLLCFDCNIAIGKLKDNPALFRAAAIYLEAAS